MANNIQHFEVKKVKFEAYKDNPQFLQVKFYSIAEGINRNSSSFTLDSMEKCIPTTYLKPVLAHWDGLQFNETGGSGDFTAHESKLAVDSNGKPFYDYNKGERPIGVIIDEPKPSIEKYQGKNFLVFTGLIWTEYNKQAVELLKKRRSNKTSVEIEVIKSVVDESSGIEEIQEFMLLGITLLGNEVSEGIEGSHLDVESLSDIEKSDNFVKFKKEFFSALHKEVKASENIIEPIVEEKATLKINVLYNKVSFIKSVKKEKESHMKRYNNMPEKYRIFGVAGSHLILFCDGAMFACPEPDADDAEFSEESVKPFEVTAEFGEEKFGFTGAIAEYAIETEKKMAEDMCKMAEEKAEMAKQVEEYGVKAGTFEEKFASLEMAYAEEQAKFKKLAEEFEVVKMSKFEEDARKAMADDGDADDETKKEFETRMANKEFKCFEDFEKEFAYAKYKKAKMSKKVVEAEKVQYSLTPATTKPTATVDVFEKAKQAVDAISK